MDREELQTPIHEEHSLENPSDVKILHGESLREVLNEKELEGMIREYIRETFHHPEGLIPVFRAKIFDILKASIKFISQKKEVRFSWYLYDRYRHVSFKDVLEGRIEIAKKMYQDNTFFGLEADGKIVCIGGYIHHDDATSEGRGVFEIRSIFTPQEFRNRGYSKKIIKAQLEELRQAGEPIVMVTESEPMKKNARYSGFQEVDDIRLKEYFSEWFQNYLLGATQLGYQVFVLFPEKDSAHSPVDLR